MPRRYPQRKGTFRVSRSAAPLLYGSPEHKVVVFRDGNTSDIIRVIMFADSKSGEFIRPSGLTYLRGASDLDTLKNVFQVVRDNVKYRADRPGFEEVRSPGYLFQSGVGDCKSYSIAIGAFLRALGYSYRYRFTGPSRFGNYQHVYVIATTPDGQDVIMDAVLSKFNEEAKHKKRLDIRPGDSRALAALNGIQGGYTLEWIFGGAVVAGLIYLYIKMHR